MMTPLPISCTCMFTPCITRSVRGNHDDSSLHRWSSWRAEGKELKPQHSWVKDMQHRHVEALESLPFTLSLPDYGITVVSLLAERNGPTS